MREERRETRQEPAREITLNIVSLKQSVDDYFDLPGGEMWYLGELVRNIF